MRIVVDCAHGAATTVAPRLFELLGAETVLVAAEPNGCNINVDCGSTHLGYVAAAVQEHGADLGIAVDGDADRVLVVDAAGDPIDGDHILTLLAADAIALPPAAEPACSAGDECCGGSGGPRKVRPHVAGAMLQIAQLAHACMLHISLALSLVSWTGVRGRRASHGRSTGACGRGAESCSRSQVIFESRAETEGMNFCALNSTQPCAALVMMKVFPAWMDKAKILYRCQSLLLLTCKWSPQAFLFTPGQHSGGL
jgi:hypothetical protein